MSHTATIAIKKLERLSGLIFWSQVIVIAALIAAYMYFVNKTVWNVVARQQSESSIIGLNSKLSDMEFKYITAKNNITLDMARQLGFQSVSNTTFVNRDQSASVAIR